MKFKDFFNNNKYLMSPAEKEKFTPELKFFLEQLALYQSNHYGLIGGEDLYGAFMKLPDVVKAAMRPNKKQVENAYRGDDGKNEKPVMSFTWNKSHEIARKNAHMYGHYVFSLKNEFTFQDALDTGRIEKYFGKILWNKITRKIPVGDDENELLVFGGKFVPPLNTTQTVPTKEQSIN